MIKQIQLRGISRTPSDRATADGGLAESLNFHLDSDESAPTLMPLPADLPSWNDRDAVAVFIHKTASATNVILLKEAAAAVIGWACGGRFTVITELAAGETFSSAASIGNTVIVTSSLHNHYLLWKQEVGAYKYLGTKIPEPDVRFIDEAAQGDETDITLVSRRTFDESDVGVSHSSIDGALKEVLAFYQNTWNAIINNTLDPSVSYAQEATNLVNMALASVADQYRAIYAANRAAGYFCRPRLARFALRLYNGDYIYQSVPVLLGGIGCGHFPGGEFTGLTAANFAFQVAAEVEAKYLHKVSAVLSNAAELEEWKDIIGSVDIFLSEDINYPALDSRLKDFHGASSVSVILAQGKLSVESLQSEEDIVTAVGNFYKVESVGIENITRMLGDGIDIAPPDPDWLVTQRRLDDDAWSHHETVPLGDTMTYNGRLIYGGSRVKLYPGYPYFQALTEGLDLMSRESRHMRCTYTIVFTVKDASGNPYEVKQDLAAPKDLYSVPFSWISYPDPRCTKAVLVMRDGSYITKRTFTMTEHPRLNCAYWFGGFGSVILYDPSWEAVSSDPSAAVDNDLAVYENAKQLMVSEVQNPFVFPLGGRVTLSGDIISVATTTKALSTGQFGQFPLYVFTTDGIWALPLSEEGKPAASQPMSRDVAIRGTVSPIDQAIVFVSDKGVMYLQGSQVVNISENMNGRHYTLEWDAAQKLDKYGSPWRSLLGAVSDNTPFMTFMKGAKIAYDYAGNRLVCFNAQIPGYQYVYMLGTSTWHKFSLGTGIESPHILNGYPDTLVSCRLSVSDNPQGEPVILDFTTWLDVNRDEAESIRGIIVTRPIDFGAPDVRKTLKNLRIRGNFNRMDMQYILLGSMDGHSWGILPSLGGGSYKLFRLVILANLSPTERISWIDCDVEERWGTKLR